MQHWVFWHCQLFFDSCGGVGSRLAVVVESMQEAQCAVFRHRDVKNICAEPATAESAHNKEVFKTGSFRREPTIFHIFCGWTNSPDSTYSCAIIVRNALVHFDSNCVDSMSQISLFSGSKGQIQNPSNQSFRQCITLCLQGWKIKSAWCQGSQQDKVTFQDRLFTKFQDIFRPQAAKYTR